MAEVDQLVRARWAGAPVPDRQQDLPDTRWWPARGAPCAPASGASAPITGRTRPSAIIGHTDLDDGR